jgi:hypothetical protein
VVIYHPDDSASIVDLLLMTESLSHKWCHAAVR